MTKPSKKPKEDDSLKDFFNVFGGDQDPQVLHYTPGKKEFIEITAPIVVEKMREMRMDCEIHFNGWILEVERDQSADFIIEAYYEAVEIVKDIKAGQRKNNKGPKGPK